MLIAKRPLFALSVIAAALCLAAPVGAQQPGASRALKMQSIWPASLTLQDNFKMFAERVEKLTSGAIKIEAPA